MKILVVSPVPTDPVDAGNRARIASLVRVLSQAGHEMHFAYVPMEPCDRAAMVSRFGAQRLHMLSWAPRAGAARLAVRIARKFARVARLDAGYMVGLDDWYDPRISGELHQLQALHRFDAVFVEYVFMSKALEAFDAPCLRVLDTHDNFGMRHRHYLKAGLRPQWFSTTRAEETEGFERADFVLAIQSTEARDFAARLRGADTRVLLVGHLTETTAPIPPSAREAAVFVGSSNPLNVAGARYFIERVLPLVWRARPGFEVLLAGAVCTEIEDRPGVVKLGFVPKLQDAFGAAMLAVNPIRAGTGLNIKLLEAMAAPMPIVTTRSGARGVEEFEGQGFLLVNDDDANGFAEHVLRLVDDLDARRRLAAGAHAAAEQWNKAQVGTLWAALAERPGRLGPQETSQFAQATAAFSALGIHGA
jgi:glycosyltransferase involved in cell wall biosynthesis